jgi:hypothetical protein
MPTVLRAYGAEFDVDAFVAGSALPVCAVKRRGEPIFPKSQPDGRRHERSGVHVGASRADFSEFQRQIEESVAFLRQHEAEIRRLREFPGVEGVTLDFGLYRRDDVWVQCDRLSAVLVSLAGSLGLEIEISHYRRADNVETKEDNTPSETLS